MEVQKPVELDLLDTTNPALSSTDDMPVVETKPDSTPESKEAPAAPDEGKTQEESATSPDEPSASDEPKKAKGVQKRLDELTKQREDERRRAEAAESRLDRALKALEYRQPTEQKEDSEDPEPVKPAKTEDQDAYAIALEDYISKKAAWISRREVKTALAEQDRKASEKQIQEAQNAARTAYQGRIEKASEKYPDYHAVAESPDVAVSIPMAHAILHHEQGPDIAYFLGKNPQEAQRISSLTPAVQLVELGLIVAKLNTPAPPKPPISHAPKPIEPLKAGSEKAAKSPEDESMEEYAARRRKELNERRPGVRH